MADSSSESAAASQKALFWGCFIALVTTAFGFITRLFLIGTWAAADWAIRFYRRHGFELVSPVRKTALLKTYWTVPERQIATSVVLANPPLDRSQSSASPPLGGMRRFSPGDIERISRRSSRPSRG